jgi:hypothetical protein
MENRTLYGLVAGIQGALALVSVHTTILVYFFIEYSQIATGIATLITAGSFLYLIYKPSQLAFPIHNDNGVLSWHWILLICIGSVANVITALNCPFWPNPITSISQETSFVMLWAWAAVLVLFQCSIIWKYFPSENHKTIKTKSLQVIRCTLLSILPLGVAVVSTYYTNSLLLLLSVAYFVIVCLWVLIVDSVYEWFTGLMVFSHDIATMLLLGSTGAVIGYGGM